MSRVLRWLRLRFDYMRGVDLITPGDNVMQCVVKTCDIIRRRRAHRATSHRVTGFFASLLTRRTCVAVIFGTIRAINGNNCRRAFDGARCQSRHIVQIEPDNSDQCQTAGENRQPLKCGGRTSEWHPRCHLNCRRSRCARTGPNALMVVWVSQGATASKFPRCDNNAPRMHPGAAAAP